MAQFQKTKSSVCVMCTSCPRRRRRCRPSGACRGRAGRCQTSPRRDRRWRARIGPARGRRPRATRRCSGCRPERGIVHGRAAGRARVLKLATREFIKFQPKDLNSHLRSSNAGSVRPSFLPSQPSFLYNSLACHLSLLG